MEPAGDSLKNKILALIVLVAILGGIVLRFAQLGKMSLWFDEGYTAWVVSLSPGEIVRVIRVDTSPPLFYLLLRGWVGMFGHSEAAMRSLSAVASSAALVVFLGITRRVLHDRRAVAAATCLAAVSFMTISYAHEARFYTLTLLLTAIGFYLVLLLAERSTPWRLALLVVAWIASLYTANTMAIYLAAMGIAWLILPGPMPLRRRLIDLCIVTFITAIAFLPWLPTTLAQMRAIHGNFWPSAPTGRDFVRTISILCGVNEHAAEPATLLVLNAALAGIVLINLLDPGIRRIATALVVGGFVPVVLIFVVSRIGTPVFIERIFLPTTLFAPLLIVLPMTLPVSRWRRFLCGIAVVAFFVLSIRSIPAVWLGEHSDPWREICQSLKPDQSNRRLIVFAANEGELMYDYYYRNGDYSPSPNLLGLPADFFSVDPPKTMRRVQSDADLAPLVAALGDNRFREVVLVKSHPWWSDPAGRVPDYLGRRMSLIGLQEFTNITVYYFSSAR